MLASALRIGVPLACAALVALPQDGKQQRPSRGLDKTQAFYYPAFAGNPKQVLGRFEGGTIDTATYLRYLAARHGTRYLEDLAFDIVLGKECKVQRVARSAPLLARGIAARRMLESERKQATDPDGNLQRKFATEALRALRADALVGLQRAKDPAALKSLFERLHGKFGEKVKVRHVLVAFQATANRTGKAQQRDIEVAALARARQLHAQCAESGKDFTELLGASDDRGTKRMLRDPKRKLSAGFLEGYNYQRHGSGFAKAVRGLAVGAVSAPVRSTLGYHLIQVTERKVTSLEQVRETLTRHLRQARAKPSEVMALRKRLLAKYRYRSSGR